ncbi:pyridoxal phosphate-dependent decarboxylase family protein [Wohlfahrtiimonas chitiniclastica]|uniref:pyridoxal phosphate-dependent decarboxylase family protein n=1 Tax=Wohlfahrtiimonas chitiniclastica TaxID=400946 RepID=UPI0007B697E9|nr:aspartate aminotransferase family protein [Wohlfahrtiimonas chitiniclastica]KZX38205.1 2,4-diaminobutyrate decarboxylase [Wohlfahrtiimonas chitiniclastica]
MNKDITLGITETGEAGANTYRQLMTEAVSIAADWLEDGKMYDGMPIETLRSALKEIELLPNDGIGDQAALKEANQYFLQHALQVHHPLCSAHLHCPTTLASQLAEVLINVSNQSMDSWDQSPSATLFEERIITELRRIIGYPSGDAGIFTSGGTQSNFMGLLLAREYCLKTFPQYGKGSLVVICSAQAHFSVQQSVLLLGFEESCVVSVPCDDGGRIIVEALADTLDDLAAQGRKAFAIVATAGTTDTGAIDDLTGIATLAQQHQTWLHVDAAWGGILLFSHQYRDRLAGIEHADSIALDFHKQFLQTISCGAFVLKEGANYELIRRHDDYLNPVEDELEGVPNLVSKSIQTTRRFDALKLWMSLRSIGAKQYGDMVDYSVDLAQQVAKYVDESEHFELVNSTQIASVLFRIKPESLDGKDSTKTHRYIAQLLFDEGHANLGITRRDGIVTLKMTLLNPHTRFEHVKGLLSTIEKLVGC